MSIRAEAEENLRVIRSLMEKATVYRAISAPGALIGGLCSILWTMAISVKDTVDSPDAKIFVEPWVGILLVTAIVNFTLLRRDAARRKEAFVSPGMRLALRAMLPALLAGGLCLFIIAQVGPAIVASLWVLLYGVSLLAASHFAPKSICWLGRGFFVAGVGLLAFASHQPILHPCDTAHLIMGATFGGFHLIYAACTWPRRSTERVPAAVA